MDIKNSVHAVMSLWHVKCIDVNMCHSLCAEGMTHVNINTFYNGHYMIQL